MNAAYRLKEKAPPEALRDLSEHPEVLRDLLFARGLSSREDAARFLSPDFARDSHDPFLMPDLEKAARRIISAIENNELICVWSDYDCDGIPGGVMLSQFLRDLKARVRLYVPHRHAEGYGLNESGLQEAAQGGVSLIVTIDLGTTEALEIERARALGMEVIVADHHLPARDESGADALPNAFAVLNPYRKDSRYPFPHLCGTGVAWKLVQGILAVNEKMDKPLSYPQGKEKWLLDLVGLATLSDMVPLIGENRMLASYGLLVMRKTKRPGLRALFSLLRMNMRSLTEDDLTFMISPRINAASRMDSPEAAVRLLECDSEEEAYGFAQALQLLNDKRKGTVASIVKEARERLQDEKPKVIALGNPAWRPGVLGLVANKLCEQYGCPVFLWGREGGETLKGSCRAKDGSAVDLMRAASGVFEDFGGHENSGGFSLRPERAHELYEKLLLARRRVRATASESEVLLDRELDLADAPASLSQVLKLAPFGQGNRKPLFLFPGVSVSHLKMFGKNRDHLEIILTRQGAEISGVSFFSTPEQFHKTVEEGMRVDVVGSLEKDFRGRARVRVLDVL